MVAQERSTTLMAEYLQRKKTGFRGIRMSLVSRHNVTTRRNAGFLPTRKRHIAPDVTLRERSVVGEF